MHCTRTGVHVYVDNADKKNVVFIVYNVIRYVSTCRLDALCRCSLTRWGRYRHKSRAPLSRWTPGNCQSWIRCFADICRCIESLQKCDDVIAPNVLITALNMCESQCYCMTAEDSVRVVVMLCCMTMAQLCFDWGTRARAKDNKLRVGATRTLVIV